MLKTYTLRLTGRDAGTTLQLTELPAMLADRAARAALRAVDESEDGGVITLVFKHLKQVRALGEPGLQLLNPFVDARLPDGTALDLNAAAGVIRDWRNIEKIQQQALYLHAGFMIDRKTVEPSVAMVGDHLLRAAPEDVRIMFCSPLLAAVLESGRATYREMETVLSTEDVFNLQEINNVRAIRQWHESQKAAP